MRIGDLCVAVDDAGNVVSSTDPTGGAAAWTTTQVDGMKVLDGVSCASTALCVAVDNTGNDVVGTATTHGKAPQHSLTVSLAGPGSGSVVGPAISCPGICSGTYPGGAAVSLTATPASGSTFTGWTGACAGSDTCTLTMATDQTVTATFVRRTTSTGPSGSPSGSKGTGGRPRSVSTAEIAALLRREITPSGKAANIPSLLRRGEYKLAFKALEAGRAVVNWYMVPAGARLAKRTKAAKLIATGRFASTSARTATITITLTVAGKRLLKGAKRLKLTAKGTFTPTGKAPISATNAFVLRR